MVLEMAGTAIRNLHTTPLPPLPHLAVVLGPLSVNLPVMHTSRLIHVPSLFGAEFKVQDVDDILQSSFKPFRFYRQYLVAVICWPVPRDFSASALFVSLNVCNFATLRYKINCLQLQTVYDHLEIV